MPFNSAEQVEQARQFLESNQSEVDRLSSLLSLLSKCFLEKIGAAVLPADEVTTLEECLASGDLKQLYLRLNRLYGEFVRAGVSDAIWCVLGGLSSWCDATGSYWPYMTFGSRQNRLVHAQQWHDEACVAIEYEAAKAASLAVA
ncbi:hypothetical protein ACRCPS_17760 [Pseudomonas aeruginosa]